MNHIKHFLLSIFTVLSIPLIAQDQAIIDQIIQEANENSQLEILGQELMDGIGPRLVGTPQMKPMVRGVAGKEALPIST